ncbi:MAG: hypothetical protein ACO3RV_02090 [Luteolibacter sp.]
MIYHIKLTLTTMMLLGISALLISQNAAAGDQEQKPALEEKVEIPDGWALATGEIEEVADLGNGKFAYTLSYPISETETQGIKNADGELIKGPIRQHVMSNNPPAAGQKIRVIYQVDEPIIRRLLDPIVPAKK